MINLRNYIGFECEVIFKDGSKKFGVVVFEPDKNEYRLLKSFDFSSEKSIKLDIKDIKSISILKS